MDPKIAQLVKNIQSYDDLKQFETNARTRNALNVDVNRAIEARSAELGRAVVAEQTGLDLSDLSPAEEKIVQAAAVYAGIKKRKGTNAGRMFLQLRNQGFLGAAEIAVAKAKPTMGYKTLASENKSDLSYEQIIIDHPDEFSARALWYARRTLKLPNVTEKPPAAGTTSVQRRTEQLLAWLRARSDANSGKMPPYTNAEAAAAVGMGDMHKFGRVQGNIQSRLDFACYRANLPPLGLTAVSPFDDAWGRQNRDWSFPVEHMQAVAQAHTWRVRDYTRILEKSRALPGVAHIVWKAELSTNESGVRAWAFGSPGGEDGTEEPTVQETARKRNPAWSRDELVLALDLYLRFRHSPLDKGSAEIAELSDFLGKIARQLGRTQGQTFRNVAGVYMKLMNFRRLDPDYTSDGKVGLERGNKEEEPVWRQFSSDTVALATAVAAIRKRFSAGELDTSVVVTDAEAPYWVFVCNPKKWAIDQFLDRRIEHDSWGVRPSDQTRFAAGQLGLVRVGVDRRSLVDLDGKPRLEAGIYALCEIESAAQPGTGANDGFWTEGEEREPGWPTVKIRYLKTYADRPLTIARLRREAPAISPLLLDGFQGSSFPISAEDFHTVTKLLGEPIDELTPKSDEIDPTWERLATLEARYLNASPEVKARVSKCIERGGIGALIKKALGFKCQVCEALGQNPVGFFKPSGEPYAEAHHVMPVSRKEVGLLSASNIMVLCANHHRQMHFGGIHVDINKETFDFVLDNKALSVKRFKRPE